MKKEKISHPKSHIKGGQVDLASVKQETMRVFEQMEAGHYSLTNGSEVTFRDADAKDELNKAMHSLNTNETLVWFIRREN